MESLECEVVIKNAWTERVFKQRNREVEQKLGNCRRHLLDWSKRMFGNNRIELKRPKERFREMLQNQFNVDIQREEVLLKGRIKELLKCKEIY